MSYNNNCNGEAANTCKNTENRSERKNKGVSGEFGEEINERKLTELDNIEATGGVVTVEKLADMIAERLFVRFEILQEVEIEVAKLGVDVGFEFSKISTKMRRCRTDYIK